MLVTSPSLTITPIFPKRNPGSQVSREEQSSDGNDQWEEWEVGARFGRLVVYKPVEQYRKMKKTKTAKFIEHKLCQEL